MHVTKKQLHYILKGVLEFFEYCATSKRNQKILHKVAEERDLKPGEIIYLDLLSQKKPSYGGSKSWVLIQDSDMNKNGISSQSQTKIWF